MNLGRRKDENHVDCSKEVTTAKRRKMNLASATKVQTVWRSTSLQFRHLSIPSLCRLHLRQRLRDRLKNQTLAQRTTSKRYEPTNAATKEVMPTVLVRLCPKSVTTALGRGILGTAKPRVPRLVSLASKNISTMIRLTRRTPMEARIPIRNSHWNARMTSVQPPQLPWGRSRLVRPGTRN